MPARAVARAVTSTSSIPNSLLKYPGARRDTVTVMRSFATTRLQNVISMSPPPFFVAYCLGEGRGVRCAQVQALRACEGCRIGRRLGGLVGSIPGADIGGHRRAADRAP